MRSSARSLAARIRGEIDDLERVRARAVRSWVALGRGASDADQTAAYLDSVAFNLHGFYSGVERLLELAAQTLDGELPVGNAWHRDLVDQVAAAAPGVRPAVIGPETAAALDELRRFRHLARNAYATNLVPGRVARLVDVLRAAWPRLREELLAFADFLDAVEADG